MANDSRYYFFNVHLCNVCKSRESFNDAKLCSQCKLVSYCSKEHQQADWKNHKDFCKAVQKICRTAEESDLFDAGATAFRQMSEIAKGTGMENELPDLSGEKMIIGIMELVEHMLDRKSNGLEKNMVFFPKICRTCSTRRNIPKDFVCKKCFSVAYCSAEHRRLDVYHKNVCPGLQKVLDVNVFVQNGNSEFHKVHLIKPEQAVKLNLDACDMQSFIANYVRSGLRFEEEAVVSLYYSGVLTFARTINRIPNFILGKTLTIHIVGASDQYEGQIVEYWENLLHLFPILETVTLIHIGPNISGGRTKLKLCDDCNSAKRSIHTLYFKQFYHDYHKNSSAKKPDVIIAFNSGLYAKTGGFSPWEPSLPLLFKYEKVPLIVTEALKEEVERDLGKLLRADVIGTKKVNVAVKCEENPFNNLKPWKYMSYPFNAVVYDNSYVYALVVEKGQ